MAIGQLKIQRIQFRTHISAGVTIKQGCVTARFEIVTIVFEELKDEQCTGFSSFKIRNSPSHCLDDILLLGAGLQLPHSISIRGTRYDSKECA